MPRKKKSTQETKNVRKFVLVHTQGQEEIFAETPYEGILQGYDQMKAKGLHPGKDWKDFYEVKT
jgi:hypothetical protein